MVEGHVFFRKLPFEQLVRRNIKAHTDFANNIIKGEGLGFCGFFLFLPPFKADTASE